LVETLVAAPPGWSWRDGDTVFLVGAREAAGEHPFPLGGTRWATRRGRRGGRLPDFDPAPFAACVAFVVAEVAAVCAGRVSDLTAVHDVGAGGLATALAEVCAATSRGLLVDVLAGVGELFAEFPGRFIVASRDPAAFTARAAASDVPAAVLGVVGGSRLRLSTLLDLDVEQIARRRGGALSGALAAVG